VDARRVALRTAPLFFLYGAAALVVETTWLRWLRLLFGATAPATSATLVAFFAGQALGAAWAARRLVHPGRAAPRLALGAAIGAALVPLLLAAGERPLQAVYDPLSEWPAALFALRFAVALGATAPAALCLGAALPALLAAGSARTGGLGSPGAGLYAVELGGAALGAAAAAFGLPVWLGVRGSYALAAGVLVLVAALAPRGEGAAPAPPTASARGRARAPATPEGATGLVALAALSGFGTFAAQVLLVQAFAQVLNQSVQAFGAVLVVVLLSLAAGAAGTAAWLRRPGRDVDAALVGALVAAGLGLAAFPALLFLLTDGLRYLGGGGTWAGYVGAALGTAALSAGPALLPAAAVFPLLFGRAARLPARTDSGSEGTPARRLARLFAANTAGAVAGALAAPFVLLPVFDLWPAFLALGLLYAGGALLVRPASRRARRLRDVAVAGGFAALLVLASPLDLPLVARPEGAQVLYEETTPSGVVAVLERDGERLVQTDNHYALGGTAELVHEARQGHLPLLLHPEAARVAFVGTATGITAGAATAHPVQQIALVEIVPGVVRAARRFFADANRGVHDDPRATVVLDDARNFLAATSRRFDVVVADLFVPWRSGTGSLYTREHFENVRAHLREDGLFCQWLPLYQLDRDELRVVLATFLDVFPRAALFRGDFYGAYPIAAAVGFAGEPAGPEKVGGAARRLRARGLRDRWVTDPAGVWSLYVAPLGPLRAELADVSRNTDDRPRLEFRAGRGHTGAGRGKLDPFTGPEWVNFQEALVRLADRAGDDVYPDLPEGARRASLGGRLLQAAGALFAVGRPESAGTAFAAAARALPPHLVADAPPDPTAAELWSER